MEPSKGLFKSIYMQQPVTFYQLQNDDQTDINQVISNIVFKAFKNNRKVYILCPDQDYCLQLDEYFINYHQSAFFPFQLYGDGPIPPAPICLGFATSTNLKYDILINLHSWIPADFKKYREIIELVPCKSELRALTREHYKHYKKFQCHITFNELTEISTSSI